MSTRQSSEYWGFESGLLHRDRAGIWQIHEENRYKENFITRQGRLDGYPQSLVLALNGERSWIFI